MKIYLLHDVSLEAQESVKDFFWGQEHIRSHWVLLAGGVGCETHVSTVQWSMCCGSLCRALYLSNCISSAQTFHDFHTVPKSLIKECHKATFMQNIQHRIQYRTSSVLTEHIEIILNQLLCVRLNIMCKIWIMFYWFLSFIKLINLGFVFFHIIHSLIYEVMRATL